MTGMLLRRKRRVVLLVAVACLALLTACDPVKSGSAAIVGDNSLTTMQLSDLTDEVDATIAAADAQSSMSADQLNQGLVSLWVQEELIDVVAAEHGVTATQTEIDKYLAQFDKKTQLQIVTSAGIPPSGLERAVEATILRSKLGAVLAPGGSQEDQTIAITQEMVKVADEVGVSVNPRFGSWDGSIPGVQPRSVDRLSAVGTPNGSAPPSPQPSGQ